MPGGAPGRGQASGLVSTRGDSTGEVFPSGRQGAGRTRRSQNLRGDKRPLFFVGHFVVHKATVEEVKEEVKMAEWICLSIPLS